MATSFFTRFGECVGQRFFAGRERGVSFQMEVTEREWQDWQDVMVAPEDAPESYARFADVVADCRVVWDSAARQNQVAREMENSRFFSEVPAMETFASMARQRARVCTRDQIRVA